MGRVSQVCCIPKETREKLAVCFGLSFVDSTELEIAQLCEILTPYPSPWILFVPVFRAAFRVVNGIDVVPAYTELKI